MLISCNRLKSYIKSSSDIDFEHIWDVFTMRVAEVESVSLKGYDIDSVVTAKIVECKAHPNSKKLSLLKVSDGSSIYDVVCGAPNVSVGLIGAFVKVGGHVCGMDISSRKIAGYESNGMMCAWDELGIGDNHAGIIELPSDTPLGVSLCDLYPIRDIIVEIDNKSLTNRPDLWGHYGIAREICALTKHELLSLPLYDVKNDKFDLDIQISEPSLCRRYCGIEVANLANNKTPIDMQIFLAYVGMRSISLFVDLTNYIMLELGQPMHAFDNRVVKNINVKLANDGDCYTTLDKVKRNLTKDMLMITNGNSYFGIAGVMGGLDSEILPDTDSIFIESANFLAGSIRKTAISLGLRTEASSRYEKSLDPNMCDVALKRLLYLLNLSNPDMKVVSNLTDVYPSVLVEKEIVLKKETIKRYTSVLFSDDMVVSILSSLGFKVKVNSSSYDIVVPTYRCTKDVSLDADIIEELVRMVGYENIEALPMCVNVSSSVFESNWDFGYDVKRYLASSFGLHEVHSYLWYDSEMLNRLGIVKSGVRLCGSFKNDLLRDDLSFSLLPIVRNNFKNMSMVRIFELGTIIKDNSNCQRLSIILGDDLSKVFDMYQLAKGLVMSLVKLFKHGDVSFVPGSFVSYYDNKSKDIMVNDVKIGSLLLFNSACARYVGKNKCVVALDIDFKAFMGLVSENILFNDISKYPSVVLDYTVLASKSKCYDDVVSVLSGIHSDLIKSFSFVDMYEDDNYKKYTFRYELGSSVRTLEFQEINDFKDMVISHVRNFDLDIVQ